MNKHSLDPAGHLALAVSDLEKSGAFYSDLFEQLEYEQIRDSTHSAAWVTPEGFGIWIRQAKLANPRYTYFSPGLQHLCLKAKTNDVVVDVYRHMIKKYIRL